MEKNEPLELNLRTIDEEITELEAILFLPSLSDEERTNVREKIDILKNSRYNKNQDFSETRDGVFNSFQSLMN